MTKEDKELLLKDLCARLPYNVEIYIKGEYKTPRTIFCIHIKDKTVGYFKGLQYDEELIENIKPYLRPLSSMTQDECRQLFMLLPTYYCVFQDRINITSLGSKILPEHIEIITDFYNSHHLDWRKLIDKGLALEAPKDMYKF